MLLLMGLQITTPSSFTRYGFNSYFHCVLSVGKEVHNFITSSWLECLPFMQAEENNFLLLDQMDSAVVNQSLLFYWLKGEISSGNCVVN